MTDPTLPPTTEPAATPVGDGGTESPAEAGQGFASSVADVVAAVFDNLGNNGYQTGIALVVTTAVVIAMLNLKVHMALLAPVGIGAFWAGWLGWNTLTAQDNPLFPGDVSATKLWDVGLDGDMGFLIVVSVACVAAVFLWRKGTALASRIMLLVGAILGASFLYNLVEAVRVA
ncbi:MAG: hypothetical protein QNJ12_03750 [Ilumatobacter sp.]|uniref:hypothetical protein n=1 Tax=Ilumatobacter sp. TaxID=1967498 RepID=UPI002619B9A4|nr:hypothetical protein [Ilumatobacter sp.]MDJ0767877.1 hypothetical protein [Ilumatobacter sp.]